MCNGSVLLYHKTGLYCCPLPLLLLLLLLLPPDLTNAISYPAGQALRLLQVWTVRTAAATHSMLWRVIQ
jgi:hypothetical protein